MSAFLSLCSPVGLQAQETAITAENCAIENGEGTTILVCGETTYPVILTRAAFEARLNQRTKELDAEIEAYRTRENELFRRGLRDSKTMADLSLSLKSAQAARARAEERRLNLKAAYDETIIELTRVRQELQTLRAGSEGATADLIARAETAVAEGDLDRAQTLVDQVKNDIAANKAIRDQARAHYISGDLAAQRLDYQQAKSDFIRAAQLSPDEWDFVRKASELSYDAGDYRRAESFARELGRLADVRDKDIDQAIALNRLATSIYAQGRYEEAGPLLGQALEIRRRVNGPNHPATATMFNNVAINLNAQRDYEEAEKLLRRALAIRRRVYGEDHPDTAHSFNNIAFNLNAQGRYEEAEPLFRRALKTWERALGTEHPLTATIYNNLAASFDNQDRYTEAEPLYRVVLKVWERVLGPDHPSTAGGYNNLGYNLYKQGRFEEAVSPLSRALDIWVRSLGKNHPHTQLGADNILALLERIGKDDEAESVRKRFLSEEGD